MAVIVKNMTFPAVTDTTQTKRRANTPPASSSVAASSPTQAPAQQAAPQTATAPSSGLRAADIFGMMKTYLDQGL